MYTDKPIVLHQFQAELAAAGIVVVGLEETAGDVHEMVRGVPIELPDAARAVLDAHTPNPLPLNPATQLEADLEAGVSSDDALKRYARRLQNKQ